MRPSNAADLLFDGEAWGIVATAASCDFRNVRDVRHAGEEDWPYMALSANSVWKDETI